MSYATQSLIAADQDFLNRCTASATIEVDDPLITPEQWVEKNKWALACQPGFDAAYESALAGGLARPGWEAAVISDAMILSAVQTIIAETMPPEA